MMNSPSPELYLKSTATMSLHDRFTNMLKNKQPELTNMEQLQAASLKNQLLAQQMGSWPSVLAALQNIPNMKQRMGKGNIKARLSRPMMGRGLQGMTRHWSRPRGRGLLSGALSVRCSRGFQGVVSGVVKPGLINQQSGAHICGSEVMQHRGVSLPLQGKGGRGVSVGRGCDDRRHWAGSRPVPTREELDEQLDEYMSMTKSQLDAQLDAYMAEVDSEYQL